MPRRKNGEDLSGIIPRILSLALLGAFASLWALKYKNPVLFNQYLYIIFASIVGLCIIAAVLWIYLLKKDVRLNNFIKSSGFAVEIKNFIDRFGKEKNKESWNYRNYYFDQNRLDDFVSVLNEKGLQINRQQLEDYLKETIDKSEHGLLLNSVGSEAKALDSLSGSDFEFLLKRLFEAMGFSVQLTGKSGDQGADLIANRNGKRYIIQAKRYSGSVGNSAVQEAVAAKPHYDCSHAVVVSTGEYTRGAMDLAKSNNVQLVGKKELQQKLAGHLHEKWI